MRRDDAAAGEPYEVLLPIDEMADAKIVLSDDVIAESLRRGKHAEREAANATRVKPTGKGRANTGVPRDFQPPPAHGRRAAHQEGE